MALGETIVWAGLFYIFPALLIQWESDMGWSRTELTAALTIAVLASAIASPIAGRLIDQGKGPQLMSLSALMGGILLITLSFTNSLFGFYVIWTGIGVMLAGCLYEPCFALITRARGSHARQPILTITLIAGFASTLSFPTAHALEIALGWRLTAMVFGIIVIFVGAPLLAIGALKIERSSPVVRVASATSISSATNYLSNPIFWFLGLGFSCIAIVHGILLHHLLPLLHERQLDAGIAVIAASFIGPMQVIGRLLMMTSLRKLSTHALIIGCFCLLISSIILLSLSDTDYLLLALFVLCFGSAYGMVSVLRPVVAHELLGGHAYGAKSGVLACLYLSAAAGAPYLGALIWKTGGYTVVLLTVLLTAMAGLTLYLFARKATT